MGNELGKYLMLTDNFGASFANIRQIAEKMFYLEKNDVLHFMDTSNKGAIVVFKANKKEKTTSLDIAPFDNYSNINFIFSLSKTNYSVAQNGKVVCSNKSPGTRDAILQRLVRCNSSDAVAGRKSIVGFYRKYPTTLPAEWVAFSKQ